jgi:uncharacterized protein DUF3499
MNARHCVRPGCGALATASLSYHYASRTAWLDDLDAEAHPAGYDLCAQHADRFRVPLGWTRDDRRQSEQPAEPLFDIPLAV